MIRTRAAAVAALAIAAACASADVVTVPAHLAATEGNSSSSSLFGLNATSLQVFYSADFMAAAGITPGSVIDGVAYRRNGGAGAGLLTDTNFATYNIFMSQSFATPGEMTTTYANNVVGPQTQVYGGSLTVAAGSMPAGASPNAFGPQIDFTSGYTYTGGSLLIEIRRAARTGDTTSFNTDFDSTAASTIGARMLFNTSSNTAITGTLSNGAHVFQLSVVPAPASAALLGLAGLAAARRRR